MKKTFQTITQVLNYIKKNIRNAKENGKILYKDLKQEFSQELNEIKNGKPLIKEIPNILTISRAISPLIVLPFVLLGNPVGALIAAGAFAATDFFDGLIAKKCHCTSSLGVVLDQVCDKFMAIGLSLIFLPFNLAIAFNIGLEGIISAISTNSKAKGNINKSGLIGRIKTWFLSASIIFAYACPVFNFPIALFNTFFGASIILQIATAVDYGLLDYKMDKEKTMEAVEETKIIDLVDEDNNELPEYVYTKEISYHEIPEHTVNHVKTIGTK